MDNAETRVTKEATPKGERDICMGIGGEWEV